MSKKIVILNGSPRKSGNTAALCAEFAKGAEESGNTVTEFFPGGHVLSGGNWNAGDIKGKPELEEAYKLGKSVR